MPRPLSLLIQDHVVRWRDEEWPVPWERTFGRRAPLALEIGFGGGEFLEEQAAAHPERDHVGIELSWTSATRLFRRLERRSLTNVRVLLAEAEVAVGQLFATESLVEVFVNHPCPWPKARHGERRLMRPEFVALLSDRMEEGARMTLVTDHADYASWAAEVLEDQDALVSCHPTTEVASIPGRRPTRYQEKAMARGIPIHFFEWRKARNPRTLQPRPTSDPLDPLDAMPSLTLRDTRPTAADRPALFAEFEPTTAHWNHRGVETVIRFLAAYAGQDGFTWLIETLVIEDRLHQEFGIQVVRHREGNLLVKLASLARPHPTPGVKSAVWRLGQWLLERDPALELKHENVGREITGAAAVADEG